jgi:trans-aconitate methyltransferase
MNKKLAENIMKETQENYEKFAEDFSSTRQKPWPEFPWLKKYIENESKILELGCGNGRLLSELKDKHVDYTGIDFSPTLIKLAKKAHPKADFIEENITKFKSDEKYNNIVCIAALHHIPSNTLRISTLKHWSKYLKPDGKLMVSVWNLWQKRYCKYIAKAIIRHVLTLGRYEWTDCWIPWKKNQKKPIMRYYHAFTLGGFKRLLKKSGYEVMETNSDTSKNFTCICKIKTAKAMQNPVFSRQSESKSFSNQPQPATSQKLT